jgi:hypothetical protein
VLVVQEVLVEVQTREREEVEAEALVGEADLTREKEVTVDIVSQNQLIRKDQYQEARAPLMM